ncbi:MAG: tetratricopeptide repeat protein, partial [Nannocystaceae bacterium]|nr:tetratricopeptide repeat protein [Nannocystaceae bacterium]
MTGGTLPRAAPGRATLHFPAQMDCPEENALVDFVRGELDDATRDALEVHLDACELCCAVMVELARFEPAPDELAVTDTSIAPEPVAADPTRDPATEIYKVAPRLTEGDKVGRYVVLNKVGEGGMGVVYAAYDPELDRKVAIKLLMTSLGGSLDEELAEQRTRLLREAQSMARLTHPNVITVHDVGEFGEQVFVAMEFVDGGTLTQWLNVPRPWRDRLEIFVAAGRGLGAAHKADLVHRDFKPDNVLIDSEGRAAVTDFGLARPAAGKTDSFSTIEVMERTPVMSAQLTRTGALVGTPAYMAPEQLAGQRSDALADQFSFCVTLYEGLYGRRPFEGRVLGELMANVTAGRFLPPPRESDVPRRVRRAILRGLSVRPDERFPTMEALVAELTHDPARTWRRWGTVLFPGIVLGVGLLAYSRADNPQDVYCHNVDSMLSGIWDVDRRASLRAAFLATDRPYAEASWNNTEAAIEHHAQQWLSAQRTACNQSAAGEVPGSMLALRMNCLEARRRELNTLVGVLQDVDAHSLERTLDATSILQPASSCDDVEALARADSSLGSPDQRKLRNELDVLNTRALALQKTGKHDESAQTALKAVQLARQSGQPWSEAEALITLAEDREFQGRLEEAESLQHKAMSAALAAGNHAVIPRVAIGRVWAGADPGSSLEDTERWYQHGLAALQRTDAGPKRRIQLENGLAGAYMSHDIYDLAKQHIQLALDATANAPGASVLGEDMTWGALGRLHARQGRFKDAEDAFTKSLDITRIRYGAGHPFMASSLENVGAIRGEIGDYEGAREVLSQALELRRITLGDEHPDNANSLINLANADRHLGDHAQAQKKLEEALRLVHGTQPGTGNESDLLVRLGEVKREQGNFEGAIESNRAAVDLVRELDGPSPFSIARHCAELGRSLLEVGAFQEARRYLAEAVELLSDAEPGDPFRAKFRLTWAASFPDGVPAAERLVTDAAAKIATEGLHPLRNADAFA